LAVEGGGANAAIDLAGGSGVHAKRRTSGWPWSVMGTGRSPS
jgi:hypothetical protein